MFLKAIIFLTLTISAVFAEPPINKSGPYSPTGWRPNKPFNFPREYLPPSEIARQRQARPATQVDLEISKARVDYIGQAQDNVFTPNNRQPHKEYLPPSKSNTDFLNIQDLPFETILQQYNPTAEEQQQFFPTPQRPQYKPQNESPQRVPAKKYGVPQSVDFNIIYPDPEPRSFEETRTRQTTNGGDIADFAPDVEDTPNSYARTKQGQYFVLGPDYTLQRVVFTATQDEEEKRTNGFTAQLKYTPIGELRDPVFRYNNRGQLVRVLKK